MLFIDVERWYLAQSGIVPISMEEFENMADARSDRILELSVAAKMLEREEIENARR
jgi:hypothetical protein